MNDEAIMSSISETRKPSFVDRDVVFRAMTDEDYDSRLNGVSRASFCNVYLIWIQYCNSQLNEVVLLKSSFMVRSFYDNFQCHNPKFVEAIQKLIEDAQY